MHEKPRLDNIIYEYLLITITENYTGGDGKRKKQEDLKENEKSLGEYKANKNGI